MGTSSWMTSLALYARRGLSAMYVRNRAPTKTLDGRNPYEVLYNMKLGLGDLCAFGSLCAIVGPSENLKWVDCGLSHEHQQGAFNICLTYVHTLRVWSCSCYTVWTNQPVVGNVFKFSAQNDALDTHLATL